MSPRAYLGDGVFAELDDTRNAIKLTTHDGVSVTNTIYLDETALEALQTFLEAMNAAMLARMARAG